MGYVNACVHAAVLLPVTLACCDQDVLGVADWVLASGLSQLLPLFDKAAFIALRSYAARVLVSPPFVAASSVWSAAQAVLSPSFDSINTSSSINSDLTQLFTEATLKAFPVLRCVRACLW
jgi:hypothetical protein